ncbi:MAG: thioredoxin domain-containing protein [Verrucomicrobia bacterium]|nr:thioredoxin domain-containing protein [Verrucomicrobiota bacterium]
MTNARRTPVALFGLCTFIGITFLLARTAVSAEPAEKVDWQPWSDSVFAQAQKEGRFVLLNLGAGWCHWCHVMDETTYLDPDVIKLIRSHYIAVSVDQDSRPDLANRYEDYGWPATVVFKSDKSEIVKRRGYIPPRPMVSLLQAIVNDPTPGPSVLPDIDLEPANESSLNTESRDRLRQLLIDTYDQSNQGWGTVHKWLDWDILEYCMSQTSSERFGQMARSTLAAQLNLMDPVWGGVYQYSTDGDWRHPHYEKIMQMQAEDLRIYAEAYALWQDDTYLQAARQIRAYLKNFLTSPDGAFYTSQDADLIPGQHGEEYFRLSDAQRRALGVPRIDTHIYARENGWAIDALATLYAVTGDKSCLDDATRAANWIVERRALADGGYRHDEADTAGPYLGDTLAMGRAFLTLYMVTADLSWLQKAENAVKFVAQNFYARVGYVTSVAGSALQPAPQVDENVDLARLANLLSQYTGKPEYEEIAKHALQFLTISELANRRGFLVAGILLADQELGTAPLHITVVGRKSDPAAQSLFASALKQASSYKRIEWLDRTEAVLPNRDVQYPDLDSAAAYVCTDRSCSPPIDSPEKLTAKLRR